MNKIIKFQHKKIHIMNKVGIRIKKFREEKGIRQEYIANELEMSQSNYCRLEKDDRRLNILIIIKISQVLETPISVLINEENHQNNINLQNNSDYISSLKDEIYFLRKIVEKK